MRKRLLITASLFTCLGSLPVFGQSTRSVSLDQRVVELKEARSLAALCQQEPQVKECQFAVGECMLDVFGFYKDPDTSREIPAVRTKDFDGAAPSRGFEVTFYPVAMRLLRYEGCAGCALIYQYPTKVTARINGQSYNMPILARGGYYVPSGLRRAILASPSSALVLDARTTEGQFKVNISAKALNAYAEMLRLLQYDKVL
jgi:hypothetical protein